jgi:hypothetical protein
MGNYKIYLLFTKMLIKTIKNIKKTKQIDAKMVKINEIIESFKKILAFPFGEFLYFKFIK